MLTNLDTLLNEQDNAKGVVKFFTSVTSLQSKCVKNDQDIQAQQDNASVKLEAAIDDGDTLIESLKENSKRDSSAVLTWKNNGHKTAVRDAMRDLHLAFDCTRDSIVSQVEGGRTVKKSKMDYIKSLYVHVNRLSTWALYWKPGRESNLLLNIFYVL